jgi:hypothetical protein
MLFDEIEDRKVPLLVEVEGVVLSSSGIAPFCRRTSIASASPYMLQHGEGGADLPKTDHCRKALEIYKPPNVK